MNDENMEAQVWQRVQAGKQEVPASGLRQMQREAMELAELYRGLASRTSGRQQELSRQLYRGEKSNALMLAGIGMLSGQREENVKLWQPGKEHSGKLLERCYHRTRRCMVEYLSRSADGEYGAVFRSMADREGEHCAMIAELLGSLG